MVAAMKVRRFKDLEVSGLGARIEDARKKSGQSVSHLAKAAKISRVYWYDIESEKIRDALPEDTLRRIEAALGVDLGVKFHD